jgi:hypothetical protein
MKDSPDMLDYASPTPRRSGASRAAVILVGLVVGTGLWFWLFGLMFTGSYSFDFYGVGVVPLLLMALAAAVLGAFAPRQWLLGVGALSAPTVLMSVIFFGAATGRGHEWGHIRLAAMALVCSFAPAALTRLGR